MGLPYCNQIKSWTKISSLKLQIISPSGNFPAISDDLVNSYHLLLSCLDLFYANAMTTRHTKEMVNPEFIEGNNTVEVGNKCVVRIWLVAWLLLIPARGPSIAFILLDGDDCELAVMLAETHEDTRWYIIVCYKFIFCKFSCFEVYKPEREETCS